MCDNTQINIDYDTSISGFIDCTSSSQDGIGNYMATSNIDNVITSCLPISPYILLTIQDMTVAVVHNSNGSFILLHSHSTDDLGYPCTNGSAGALYFQSQSLLLQYLRIVFSGQYYVLRTVLLRPVLSLIQVS